MTKTKLISYISVILLAVLLVLQFMPYWQYPTTVKNKETGDKEEVMVSASMQSYVWLVDENKDLSKIIQTELENKDFVVDDIIGFPIIILVLGVLGIVFLLIKSDNFAFTLLPLAAGIIGIACLLTIPALKISSADAANHTAQLIVSILLTVAGGAGFGLGLADSLKK